MLVPVLLMEGPLMVVMWRRLRSAEPPQCRFCVQSTMDKVVHFIQIREVSSNVNGCIRRCFGSYKEKWDGEADAPG